MRAAFFLAWRYLRHHRLRTVLLVLCVALVVFLPLAVHRLVGHFERSLGRRAASVPLLLGARGSRFDLVLSSLYFRGHMRERLSMAEVERLRADDLCRSVPVHVRHTAGGHAVVGTTLEYYETHGLRVRAGTLPLRLGDAVLGWAAARALGIGAGEALLTDVERLHDIGGAYPLQLRVVGVLAEAASPDDDAVFVDLKTSWVIEGLGHGHADVSADADTGAVLERNRERVALDGSVVQYRRITPENIDTFHFHGDPATHPVTAVQVWPRDARAATILKGRYAVSDTARMLVPRRVVEELMGFVFRLKRFFDANVLTVALATLLFMVLIVMLTLKIREREMDTLFRIGCSRGTVLRLQAAELGLVLSAGTVLGVAFAEAAYRIGLVYRIGF
jgi:putative ABC transport system permease protein